MPRFRAEVKVPLLSEPGPRPLSQHTVLVSTVVLPHYRRLPHLSFTLV